MPKRKSARKGALTNNKTPKESLPKNEFSKELTDAKAAYKQELAAKADRREKEHTSNPNS